MVTLKTLQTTAQYLFFLVFLRCSSVSRIPGYTNIYAKKIIKLKAVWITKGHSTDHAIVHLADQIWKSFENNNYTLGVFINLSKAFDTVDDSIQAKKIEMYGVNITNILWFASYLNDRKLYIKITEFADDTDLLLERSDINTLFKTVNDELIMMKTKI